MKIFKQDCVGSESINKKLSNYSGSSNIGVAGKKIKIKNMIKNRKTNKLKGEKHKIKTLKHKHSLEEMKSMLFDTTLDEIIK